MPRTVDHAQRRAEIADAVVRVAARKGLHAVTIRAVAAEAGSSLRFVQYYFPTKADLLTGTLNHLEQLSHDRWQQRLIGLPDPPPTRALVEAFCAEALPTDEASRAFHLIGTSYAVLAMTDPELAQHPFVANIDRLEERIAQALAQAQLLGELADSTDTAVEATRLVMLTHGLGTSVLIGQHTPDSAAAVVRYHLDQIFLASHRPTTKPT
ncbi:TetR/AcrR family transcriptional regulator [Nocardia ignorata]|uniref:TetR family transcriptional regulator n=1 Tax=Nocardia ignorata TaxID=145285 RepID=A0A4R6NXZ5_NOCIG|nr:TetR family transcriptional regulator C-terminal domain-containing protein [Nocardia ignorata]TDP28644.1 TetR family transcriptional regulator [Nocardia ignorata]